MLAANCTTLVPTSPACSVLGANIKILVPTPPACSVLAANCRALVSTPPACSVLDTKCRMLVRFEVFTAVTMKKVLFWDIKPSSYLTENISRVRYRAQPVNAM
jgi:hypothetical protein